MNFLRLLVALSLVPLLLLTCTPGRLALITAADEPRDPVASATPPGVLVPVIRFDGPVDPETVAQAQQLLSQAQEAGARAIVIDWNSPGGSVDAGFRLAKSIEDSPVPVVCVVDGEAASMAYYILQSCSQRLMTRRSSLLIHQPSMSGKYGGGYTDWQNVAEVLRVLARAMTEHCAARMKISADELEQRISGGRDYWLDWREALHVGAVDAVVPSVRAVVDGLRK